jgi:transposase-like protein
MGRKNYTPEQIIPLLRQIEVEVANGKNTEEACRAAGITTNTCYRWRKTYGAMRVDEAKQYRELEKENARLKRLVAEQAIDIQILKEVAKGKF